MLRFVPSMTVIILFMLASTCSESVTAIDENVQALLYQVPECGGSGLAKDALIDSCFSYQFDTDLAVDFCVRANCCPDSNRFDLDYLISSDTIYVAVADTAARLCRCVCNYVIHAEFTNLMRDRYIFYCSYDPEIGLVYAEEVKRGQ